MNSSAALHLDQDGRIDPAVKQRIALALIRSGRDFGDAAATAGLSTGEVIRLWQAENTPH